MLSGVDPRKKILRKQSQKLRALREVDHRVEQIEMRCYTTRREQSCRLFLMATETSAVCFVSSRCKRRVGVWLWSSTSLSTTTRVVQYRHKTHDESGRGPSKTMTNEHARLGRASPRGGLRGTDCTVKYCTLYDIGQLCIVQNHTLPGPPEHNKVEWCLQIQSLSDSHQYRHGMVRLYGLFFIPNSLLFGDDSFFFLQLQLLSDWSRRCIDDDYLADSSGGGRIRIDTIRDHV